MFEYVPVVTIFLFAMSAASFALSLLSKGYREGHKDGMKEGYDKGVEEGRKIADKRFG